MTRPHVLRCTIENGTPVRVILCPYCAPRLGVEIATEEQT